MEFYLVGGAVRDMEMGLDVHDYDFVVVGASPEDFSEWECVGKDFPVFLEPTHKWEVALARIERKIGDGYKGFETSWKGVTLEEDLFRRDLTINAMAYKVDWGESVKCGEPVIVGELVDPFNGKQHIEDKLLHPVSEAFMEDPVRLLRVGRFLARYRDFTPSTSIYDYGVQMEESGELDSLVADRVWKECEKALSEKHPSKFFWFLEEWYFPFTEFLHDMWRCTEDNPHHRERNVFVHTMMVVDHASKKWDDPEINFACLLHDIAKSKCYSVRGNGHGHDAEGVDMIKEFCSKFKVPNNYRDIAVHACQQHQKIHGVMGRNTNSWSRPKSIMKIFEQSSALSKPERFKKILKVCESDNFGRITDAEVTSYQQRPYLEECLRAVLDLDTKSISKRLLDEGKSGIVIGQTIRESRIAEIRKVQRKWKDEIIE